MVVAVGCFQLVLMAAAVPAADVGRAAPATAARELDRVVVVASKVAEPLQQVVGSVSTFDRVDFERRQVGDLSDLVRYEPGVGVIGDATRFGAQGVSIRGLDGNRVGMEIDGVPIAEAFSVGQFAAAGRDLADLEAIERVEILRGPASTLYGSDALAGVVAFRTRDPDDLLARGDDDLHLGARLAWSGRDDSWLRAASLATRSDDGRWSMLALAGRRSGHAADNRSIGQAHPANPLDYARDSVLLKAVYASGGAWRATLTLDRGEGDVQTDVRSQRFGPGRFSTTTLLLADDRYQRERASATLDWQPDSAWIDSAAWLAYVQRSDTRQDSFQTRNADAATRFPSLRFRRFELEQDARGVEWLAQKRVEGERFAHWHVFGLDFARTTFGDLRDGLETNLLTGSTSNVILGERFPVRDFPDSTTRELGAFWQDEIGIGARFAVVPGLRWERYELGAHPDALFVEDYPAQRVVDLSRRAWTPKLGVRFQPDAHSSFFAQYARGFRAPPFSDVNIGLSLPALNFEVRPNPDLRDEASHGLEAGWRWQHEGVRGSLSIYRNRYRDLIDSRANLGVDPATGVLVFQSVNRARARIEGVEGDLRWIPDADAAWELSLAGAWARGRDTARDRPLNSVAPARVVLGVQYAPADRDWGVEVLGSGVARQAALDDSAGALFRAPGHALFDAYAWWRPTPSVTLNLALQNLADRRHWDWSLSRGVPANAANVDFYTRPGRSLSASMSFDW